MNTEQILSNLEKRAIYYRVMIAEKTAQSDSHGIGMYETKLQVVRDIILDIYDNRPLPEAYLNKIKEGPIKNPEYLGIVSRKLKPFK